MDRKETEKLEKEREKLEKARARLEEERQKYDEELERLEDEKERLEDERERLEEEAEEMKEEGKEAAREMAESRIEELREKAREMSEAQRERLERMTEHIEKAMEGVQEQIENSIAGIDFDRIGEDIERGMENMKKGLGKIDKEIKLSFDNSTKNVGILNLRDITPEELEKMGEIRNNGIIIAPEELIGRISAKITKNMGTVVPFKKGWRIYSGSTELSKEMLEALEEPIDFVQTGYLEVSKDVSADLIKAKIRSFHNYGHVSATAETYGIIMARCLENYGQISKNGQGAEDYDIPEPPAPPKPPRR